MGLLSKLGGAIKEKARDYGVNALLQFTDNEGLRGQINYADYNYDAYGNIIGVNSRYSTDVAKRYGTKDLNALNGIDGKYKGLASSKARSNPSALLTDYPVKYPSQRSKTDQNVNQYDKETGKSDKESAYGLFLKDNIGTSLQKYDDRKQKIAYDPLSDIYELKLPDWSYEDFINERGMWQKGLSSIFDEPAWFYFKIFFDFNTNHGLFGGLLNSQYLTSATNSAAKYLYSVRKYHKQEKPKDRINALYKFASILSYINTNAPWYFKGVKNLNNAMIPVIDEFSKERYIELETFPDAIDMRLSTLMSLYSYACYDSILGKEIIPENLRKFNMTIILFQAPLRYLHTSFVTGKKLEVMGIDVSSITNLFKGSSNKVLYKSMNPSNRQTGNWANTMSMHAFSFYGCEFDRESLGNMIPGDMSNENAFNLGSNSIKITYTSVLQHTMNEFYAMMFGSDGFYFNQYSNFQLDDWDGYVNQSKTSWNAQLERYEALQDTFNNLAPGTLLGKANLYKNAIDATEALMNGLYENNNILKDIGTNFALGLLGSNMSTDAPQGNLYGDVGINSAYFKDKLEILRNGVHERTKAPFRYNPESGKYTDYHVNRTYSSYNMQRMDRDIDNFNLKNWLSTTTQKFSSKINSLVRKGEGFVSDVIENNHISTSAPYKPNPYNTQTAQGKDEEKWTTLMENKKQHILVDDPNSWDRVERPFNYLERVMQNKNE